MGNHLVSHQKYAQLFRYPIVFPNFIHVLVSSFAPIFYMCSVIKDPIPLKKWIDDHRHLLKPPVGNQQIYTLNKDFIVMIVGGPNARKDFHCNKGEEIFYQLEGDITLSIMEDGKRKDILIAEGDMFLLPPDIPHCPRRGPNTIGLVIERYREIDEWDGFMWFCEHCGHKLHEEFIKVNDIVQQLPVVMQNFYRSDTLRTCTQCHHTMEPPL